MTKTFVSKMFKKLLARLIEDNAITYSGKALEGGGAVWTISVRLDEKQNRRHNKEARMLQEALEQTQKAAPKRRKDEAAAEET